MDIRGWEERYRTKERVREDFDASPTPLLLETVNQLKPGKALDLACGTGRNTLWLAQKGWTVTAVDGAPAAIESLRDAASKFELHVDARVADLQRAEFKIDASRWNLITICYYLQRDLFETSKQGLVPGGLLLAIVHIPEPGGDATQTRMRPGELRTYFEGGDIVHYYEGKSRDPAHKRPVAEIVVRQAGSKWNH